MIRVLLMSVYRAGTWRTLYPVQSHFIRETTRNYRHIVVCPLKPPGKCDWLPCRKVVRPRYITDAHLVGLRTAGRFIQTQVDNYDLFVLCDSDAFPVHKEWAETILTILHTRKRLFAAPIRFEAMCLFPHVSFLAFPPQSLTIILPKLRLGRGKHVFGQPLTDVAAGLPIHDCFPLLKSNVWSPSPLLHTIYGDMIYHRGFGSRGNTRQPREMRGWSYWHHVGRHLHDADCTRQPITPAWINRLLGERRFEETPG